ncbi:hypothetical protein ACF0H5_015196 [Mactra antiquata]
MIALFVSVQGQTPAPPAMPTASDPVQLDTTPAVTLDTSNTITECTDLICTLEYIPEECRVKPILERNGVNCTGCNQWKEDCRRGQNDAVTSSTSDVTCPIASCPTVKIPKECMIVETYLYLGKVCNKCPTLRDNCSSNTIVDKEVQCPVQACTLQLIPTECREIPTFDYNGIKCNGCPQWRQGCKPTGQQLRLSPRVACPTIACDFYIPDECRIDQEYEFQGRMCKKCPTWREGCREAERMSLFSTGPVDHFGNRLRQSPCPLFPCNELNVPMSCIQEQPFEYRGRKCFKCPTVRPECLPAGLRASSTVTQPPELPCPVMKCERQAGIPPNCYQREEYMLRGKVCQRCPSIKQECRLTAATAPQSILAVDPAVTGRIEQDIPCPMVACPLIYIPDECREITTFQANGKTCQGCPVYRDGCMPSLGNSFPAANPVVPEIPPRKPEIECPIKACPMIAIPPECREEQPYQYQGITCYDCPKWRDFCRQPENPLTRLIDEPRVPCPMLGCPRMYIPPECLEEQTFEMRGRICKLCPKWRDGCVPSSGNRIIDTAFRQSTTPAPPPFTINLGNSLNRPIDGNQVQCPLQACNRMHIPAECREEPTFEYRGQTCKLCPRWREGCRPGTGNRIIDPMPIRPTTHAPPQLTNNNGDSQNRPDDRNQVQCPLQACNRMHIPAECREEPTFEYRGQTCKLCPRWREGCRPGSGNRIIDPTPIRPTTPSPPFANTNSGNSLDGSVDVSQVPCPQIGCPMNIPPECREAQTMELRGRICTMCPKWREGCVANNGETETTATFNKDIVIKTPSPSLTDLKGLLPITKIIDSVNAATCPELRCPDMFIPLICREESTYTYQGRTCRGCPTWRSGCVPSSNTPFNTNANG